MEIKRTRSVGIVLKDESVLLMRRIKGGKEYWVFPGGGVEAGETSEAAAVRELLEETSIKVMVDRLLYRHLYPDLQQEHFFYRCDYVSGEPMLGEGSELEDMKSGKQFYEPQWVPIESMKTMLVYPLEIRDWLLEDLENGFSDGVREASLTQQDKRESLW